MPIVVVKGSGKVQKKRKSEDDEPFHLRGMDDVLHLKIFKVSQPHFFTGAVTTTLVGGDIFYKDDDISEDTFEIRNLSVGLQSENNKERKEAIPTVLQEIRAHRYRSRQRGAGLTVDFVNNVRLDGEKRKKIQAGSSFLSFLEPSSTPEECLSWAIKYISTNDHSLVEQFIELDERIQRFETGKVEGKQAVTAMAGQSSLFSGKGKETANTENNADKNHRLQKGIASLAQQLDQLKLQGTDVFLKCIQQSSNPETSNVSSSLVASTVSGIAEELGSTAKTTIKIQPAVGLPRRPAEEKPKAGSAPRHIANNNSQVAVALNTNSVPIDRNTPNQISPRNTAIFISVDTNADDPLDTLRSGRNRLASSDSIESGVDDEDVAISNCHDVGRTMPPNLQISIRPPTEPMPSSSKQGTSSTRHNRIRFNSTTTEEPKSPSASPKKKQQTQRNKSNSSVAETVKYGNNLRPAYAMYTETDESNVSGGHASGGESNSKPTQLDLMRKGQQQLRRTIGAAMQNFHRINRKQEVLQKKVQAKLDRAGKVTTKLLNGFKTFEESREDGDNSASHLWEEKVQLRSSALTAKLRFLAAAESSSRRSNEINFNPGAENYDADSGTSKIREPVQSKLIMEAVLKPSLPVECKPQSDTGFAKPNGQGYRDMQRMRIASQRDVEAQELRALMDPSKRWFVTCVIKMREHLRRSSNSAPPCALKFIFVLQLLLKLEATIADQMKKKSNSSRNSSLSSDNLRLQNLHSVVSRDNTAEENSSLKVKHPSLRFEKDPAIRVSIQKRNGREGQQYRIGINNHENDLGFDQKMAQPVSAEGIEMSPANRKVHIQSVALSPQLRAVPPFTISPM